MKSESSRSRELFVFRHAMSAWDDPALTDYDRPLNRRGEQDAPRMGRWLASRGLVPALLVSSPAERARLTAVAVAAQLDIKSKKILWDERIYMADVGSLAEVLAGVPRENTPVMLVGHNPGLEQLVLFLAGEGAGALPRPPPGFLKTAGFARLRLPADWSKLTRRSGLLLELMVPKQLPHAVR